MTMSESGSAQSSRASIEAVRLLYPLLLRSRWPLGLIVGLGILTAQAESLGIAMVLLLLSILFGVPPDLSRLEALPFGSTFRALVEALHEPIWATLAILLVVIVRLVLVALHGVLATNASLRLGHEARLRLFRAITAMSFEQSKAKSWGELYALIDKHSYAIPEGFDAVCKLIQSITICLGIGILLIAISPLTAGVAGVAVLVMHGIMKLLHRPAEATGEAYVATAKAMSEQLIRTLQSLRTLHVIGLVGQQSRRFAVASGRMAQAQARSEVLGLLVGSAGHILVLVSVAALAVIALGLGLSYDRLLLAVGLLYRIEPYLSRIEQQRLILAEKYPSLRLIMGIAEPVAAAPAVTVATDPSPIRLLGVDFTYGNRDRPVFEKLDLTIPAGGWTLIEGPSGTGKSTLVNLLLGLIEPGRGTVLIGDTPLSAIDLAAWRRQVAVCGQDIELISGTVLENLLLGANQRGGPAVERAITVTGLAPIIADLPLGLQTPLGEQGAQLSGGQRQRIAIARAVLRDPQVLILDEGTSMLDRASQTQILFALERIMRGRTVVLIGHHLSELPALRARFDLAAQGDARARALSGALG
jgi:ABC-type multidrug transport system fused ATPase/permease subunit